MLSVVSLLIGFDGPEQNLACEMEHDRIGRAYPWLALYAGENKTGDEPTSKRIVLSLSR